MSARHAGPGGEDDGDTVEGRGPLFARVLLVGGRVLLVLAPASVLTARLTASQWRSAPLDSGGVPDHPIIQLVWVVSFVSAFALPFLLLPIGSAWLATFRDGMLTVPTVLGTRSVDLRSSRVSAVWLPGRGWSTWLYVLRDQEGRRAIVGHSLLRELPPEYRAALLAEGAGRPRLSDAAQLALKTASAIDRTRRLGIYALGWLLVLAWSLATLVVLGGMLALSGALAPDG
jgi:hypothetical protein